MTLNVLLAQYGGAAPAVGQVLGESTPKGVPSSYLLGAIFLTAFALAALFFIFKKPQSQ